MGSILSFPSRATQPPLDEQRPSSNSLPRCVFRDWNSLPGYVILLKDLERFHRAVYLGELEEVRKMVYYNRDVLNTTDKKHRTALHLVCTRRDTRMLTFLLDRKCDLNPRDGENRTPLMKDQQTPLLVALRERKMEVAEFLIKERANVNVVDGLQRYSS
ncbi:PREDICTED: ankyrin repeat domain-containing protein 7-like [Propithecus coquereli]|uniref:ankyrin repeat domain-containing protein 7-like n=1 Tax=Propithecus coquereli TaxID=379532 RepID=UPI00063F63D9|nr:PREDICTED: ankyrin repeat domain-containing protein 7-like [Propithecus coquereli]